MPTSTIAQSAVRDTTQSHCASGTTGSCGTATVEDGKSVPGIAVLHAQKMQNGERETVDGMDRKMFLQMLATTGAVTAVAWGAVAGSAPAATEGSKTGTPGGSRAAVFGEVGIHRLTLVDCFGFPHRISHNLPHYMK